MNLLLWMLYAGIVALLFGLAAASLETVVRQRGLPVRGLWVGALLGSVLLPLLSALLPRRAAGPARLPVSTTTGTPTAITPVLPEWWEPAAAILVPQPGVDLDAWLAGIWIAASVLVLAGVAFSAALLRRSGRTWNLRQVDGRTVWISRDVGPAVVGFLRSRIVLPDWILERDAGECTLVLAHEEEHIRAGDPRLIWGGLLLLMAFPWNLPLWWHWRRLRQSVELDCDLRVLSRGLDPRAYSRLLVRVSERGRPHRLMVAAISEPSTFLERRIRLMLATRPRHWELRLAGTMLLAGTLIVAACQVDRPDASPIPTTGVALETDGDGKLALVPTPSTPDAAMRLAIQIRHPELLTRGVEGDKAYVWMLTNSRGEIESSVLETNPPGQLSTSPEQLDRLFPVEQWRERWVTGVTNGAGARIFRAGDLGPDEVVLIWWEHAVEGAPTGPFFFSRENPAWTAEKEAHRARIEQYHPGVLQTGLPKGEMLWFLLDEEDQVVKTGRGLPATTGAEIRAWLAAQSPTGKIQRTLRGANFETADHRFVKAVWAVVEMD